MRTWKLRAGHVVVDRVVDWFDAGNLPDLVKENVDKEDDCNEKRAMTLDIPLETRSSLQGYMSLLTGRPMPSAILTLPLTPEKHFALRKGYRRRPLHNSSPRGRCNSYLTTLKAIHNLRLASSSLNIC